jgi:hypothetical protein
MSVLFDFLFVFSTDRLYSLCTINIKFASSELSSTIPSSTLACSLQNTRNLFEVP